MKGWLVLPSRTRGESSQSLIGLRDSRLHSSAADPIERPGVQHKRAPLQNKTPLLAPGDNRIEDVHEPMIPDEIKTLFWDVAVDTFVPEAYPDYTIFRVLEHGDTEAVHWMRRTFSEAEIRRVLRTERRLTPKSATFWAIVYGIPISEVAALNDDR